MDQGGKIRQRREKYDMQLVLVLRDVRTNLCTNPVLRRFSVLK